MDANLLHSWKICGPHYYFFSTSLRYNWSAWNGTYLRCTIWHMYTHITMIKIANISITPESFLLSIYNPSFPFPFPPSNHWSIQTHEALQLPVLTRAQERWLVGQHYVTESAALEVPLTTSCGWPSLARFPVSNREGGMASALHKPWVGSFRRQEEALCNLSFKCQLLLFFSLGGAEVAEWLGVESPAMLFSRQVAQHGSTRLGLLEERTGEGGWQSW